MTDDRALKRGPKRERDSEDGAAIGPAKLRNPRAKPAPFDRGLVPPEIVERIATHLDTDNPRATHQNHTNLILTSKFIRNVVAGAATTEHLDAPGKVGIDGGSPALKRFNGLARRLGSLAVKTYKDLTSRGGHPDEGSSDLPRDQRRGEPLAAHDITDATGPILPYQAADEKAKLLDSIMDLESDEAAGESINSLSRFSHGLDKIRSEGPLNYHGRIKTAEALGRLEMHEHLTTDHQREIDEAVTGRPELGALPENEKQTLRAQASHVSPAASNALNEPAADHNINQAEMTLVGRIDYLERQRHNAATAMVYADHGRLDVRRSIAEEIPELYNHVRAELAASVRYDRGG
ncbi:hypothetical protein ACCS93_35670 [Rhizobium ruizarguesonis]